MNIVFERLPQGEKDLLLKTKGAKLPAKDANAATRTPEPTDNNEDPSSESAKKQGGKKGAGDVAHDEVRIHDIRSVERRLMYGIDRTVGLPNLLRSSLSPSIQRKRPGYDCMFSGTQ